jgi:hypothetical protein
LTTSCSKKDFVKVNTNEIVLTTNSPKAELIVTYSGDFFMEIEGDLGHTAFMTEWYFIRDRDLSPDGRPPGVAPTNPYVFIIHLKDNIDITSARSSTITFTSESNTEIVTVRFVPD